MEWSQKEMGIQNYSFKDVMHNFSLRFFDFYKTSIMIFEYEMFNNYYINVLLPLFVIIYFNKYFNYKIFSTRKQTNFYSFLGCKYEFVSLIMGKKVSK